MRYWVLTSALITILAGCSRPYVEDDRLRFSAIDVNGNPVELPGEAYAGKVVMVDIWGAWCPPCIEQMPKLIAMQERYRDRGFEIIGVEYASFLTGPRTEYIAGLKGWLEEQGVNYTVVQGGEVGDEHELFPTLRNFAGYPTSIFLARDGSVDTVKSGYVPSEDPWYEETLRRLLDEPNPTAPSE